MSPATNHQTGLDLALSVDAFGRLVLETPDGARYEGVEPVRAFPLSEPDRWVALCDADGREVVCLESLAALAPEARALVEDELSRREFMPLIQKIVRVSGDSAPSQWDVETDRGPTRFTLDSEDDVRRVDTHRVLITDARKLRYQVLDTRVLDHHSRRLLERFF
jgi:Domain of unknown function (DUF1854)